MHLNYKSMLQNSHLSKLTPQNDIFKYLNAQNGYRAIDYISLPTHRKIEE